MRLIQLTMTGAAIEVSPAATSTGNQIYASVLVIQNNGTNPMRVGDNTTSSTKGIKLAAGTSLQVTPTILRGTLLSQWYVQGTAADVCDILYESAN